MKKILVILLALGLASCNKEDVITPSVLVREVGTSPIYYAEILHKEMYKVGDTLRIQYNQMPHHELSYPNKGRYGYTTVVIVKI
jgi:hypothetical protein